MKIKSTVRFELVVGFLKLLAIYFLLWLMSSTAHSQTLTTAETIGKGKASYLVSSNALIAKDFTTLHYGFAQVVYGVSNRIDLYAGPGVVTALGRDHVNLTAGANINLWNRGVAVSNFNLFTTGITHREEAARLLWFNSTLVSRNVKVRETALTVYSGYSFLTPYGPGKIDKLFTPPEVFRTVPAGLVVPFKRYAIFTEYNFGGKIKAFSIGLAYTP